MRIESGSAPSTPQPAKPRLHQAATQFESMLLQGLLKPLGRGLQENDGSEQEAGPLQSFATEAVAGQMARAGALGVAREIEQTLQKAAQRISAEKS